MTTLSNFWDAPKRLFPSRLPLRAYAKHSCKHKEATSAYQGLADIAPRGQRLEVAAVVDQLNLWDLDSLQLLLSLTVYDVQLLHTVQQHRCPRVDPLKSTKFHISAIPQQSQGNRLWPCPWLPLLGILGEPATAVDKWQSTRALVLLARCSCSSTLSIQRCQSQDNYTTRSQVVITLCWFRRVPSIRTFSVSYHQVNIAKSTELRTTEIHLHEN